MLLTLKIRKGNARLFAWQLFQVHLEHSGAGTNERGPLGNLLTGRRGSERVHLWQWGVMTSLYKSPLRGQIAYAARVGIFVFAMHEYTKQWRGSVADIAFVWCIGTSDAAFFPPLHMKHWRPRMAKLWNPGFWADGTGGFPVHLFWPWLLNIRVVNYRKHIRCIVVSSNDGFASQGVQTCQNC